MRLTILTALGLSMAVGSIVTMASAQPAGTVHHVGVLASPEGPLIVAFRQRLQELGYSEGRNIRFTYTGPIVATNLSPAAAVAKANELVRLKVDAILAPSTQSAHAAKAATDTIPTAFLVVDPVETGLISSLARPGGNLTGLTAIGDSFTEKQLQLLKEMAPRAKRIAILSSHENARPEKDRRESQTAADRLGVQVQFFEARTAEDIDRIFAAATAKDTRVDAIHVYGQNFFFENRARILAQAKTRRLPAMYYYMRIAREGGLMAFGPDLIDLFHRLAGVVDRILKGARPADLPVEEPTKYVLSINLKTARELGLAVPASLRARADHLFE